ncbi:MAG: FKBP-type peptidyl-prolyl cis-trans isomerase [Bacteroidetes bacterium]|nr:FKBP-type peptidyl-prolyl cis-trans isomerase [Bacteroidota bacterium]
MNEAMSRFRIIYKFWVPADLAWGKKGTGSEIPPNAVLCFDIRIVEIC